MGEFREEGGTRLCRALRPWSEFGFCSESETSPLLTALCRSDNVIKDHNVLTAVENCEACVYVPFIGRVTRDPTWGKIPRNRIQYKICC